MHSPQEPDASQCPLCGQVNLCAIAAGRAPESCWCMQQKIDPEALAAVPEAQRGKVCICPACGAPNAISPVAASI